MRLSDIVHDGRRYALDVDRHEFDEFARAVTGIREHTIVLRIRRVRERPSLLSRFAARIRALLSSVVAFG